VISYKDIEL